MATIDKAAIGFSIAIVAVGVAVAMYGDAVQSNTPTSVAPVIERPAPVMQDEEDTAVAPEAPDAGSNEDPETTTMKDEYREEEMKASEDMMALVIKFEAGTKTIEIFPSYDLTDEETECSGEYELGVSGHCVPYYIKGGVVTGASVDTNDNAVIITIEASDDGKLKLVKTSKGIEAISVIRVDGVESNDHYTMSKEEMDAMKDKHHGDDEVHHDEKDKEYRDDKEMKDDSENMDRQETASDTMQGPMTVTVDMPEGTALPGCEVDDTCYIPADVTINAGDTVSWTNSDTAAHTVTSGSVIDGPTGIFDSSLVMAGAVFEHTFEEAGTYEYFCIVHPWMDGTITVN